MPAKSNETQLWKRYEMLAGLYKFYLEQIVNFHTFYFATAGGITLFVLANRRGATPLALLLPLVISLAGVAAFAFGIRKSRELTVEIKAIARCLGLLSAHTEILEFLCFAFLAVHVLIAIGLIWILVYLAPSIELSILPIDPAP